MVRYSLWRHSLSSNSYAYSVNKSACQKTICVCMNKDLPWSGSGAKKFSLCHSNTIFLLVRLFMWLLRTNNSSIMPWLRIYFRALEPLQEIFLFNYYLINYAEREVINDCKGRNYINYHEGWEVKKMMYEDFTLSLCWENIIITKGRGQNGENVFFR